MRYLYNNTIDNSILIRLIAYRLCHYWHSGVTGVTSVTTHRRHRPIVRLMATNGTKQCIRRPALWSLFFADYIVGYNSKQILELHEISDRLPNMIWNDMPINTLIATSFVGFRFAISRQIFSYYSQNWVIQWPSNGVGYRQNWDYMQIEWWIQNNSKHRNHLNSDIFYIRLWIIAFVSGNKLSFSDITRTLVGFSIVFGTVFEAFNLCQQKKCLDKKKFWNLIGKLQKTDSVVENNHK